MLATLAGTLALVLILEGIVPLGAPGHWKDAFRRLTELSNGQVRFFGLFSVVSGVLLLLLSRLF